MTKFQKTLSAGIALAGLLAVSPLSALAADTDVGLGLPTNTTFGNVTGWTASNVIAAVINVILVVAGVVAFFWLLMGGVQWLMAGGDKEGTEKARKRITAALIGLAIVFSVFALNTMLGAFFGLNLMNFNIPGITGVTAPPPPPVCNPGVCSNDNSVTCCTGDDSKCLIGGVQGTCK